MSIRRLRMFLAAAEAESFGDAADRMNIARPALSRHILSLEEELGVQLFDRVGRRVRLSRAGEFYAKRLGTIIAELDRCSEEVRRFGQEQIQVIRMGLLEFVGLHEKVVDSVRMLRTMFPSLELLMKPLGSAAQIKALEAGLIDVGFLHNWPSSSDLLDHVTIAMDEWMIALPPDHALTHRSEIALADLAGENFVSISPSVAPMFLEQLMAECRAHFLMPRITEYAPTINALYALVMNGAGVSFVTTLSVPPSGVVVRPLRDLTLKMSLDFVWRRDEQRADLAAAIQTIAKAIQSGSSVA